MITIGAGYLLPTTCCLLLTAALPHALCLMLFALSPLLLALRSPPFAFPELGFDSKLSTFKLFGFMQNTFLIFSANQQIICTFENLKCLNQRYETRIFQ